MDLQEIGWGEVDWIDLTRDRGRWQVIVKVVIKFQVA
jgi:hypothetical protein